MAEREENHRMSAITEFLFPAPARRSALSIVGWWEKRRLPYNLAVGTAGLLSIGVGGTIRALPPDGMLLTFVPWQPIVAFGVLANVCYLLGPAVEIVVDKLWGRQVLPTGPALYRMGLTFSVGLALLPALMMVIFWVARVVMAIF